MWKYDVSRLRTASIRVLQHPVLKGITTNIRRGCDLPGDSTIGPRKEDKSNISRAMKVKFILLPAEDGSWWARSQRESGVARLHNGIAGVGDPAGCPAW